MSGHLASLLLHKGVKGDAYYEPSKTWHEIRIDKNVKSLDDIDIRYTKRIREYGNAHVDMLRCLNVGGSNRMIYRGMHSMCRDDRVESEEVQLPAYRFGTVTDVLNDDEGSTGDSTCKEVCVKFEFAASEDEKLASKKIKAKGSDLLYWSVAESMSADDAASRMGVGDSRSSNSGGEDEDHEGEDDDDEEDDVLPPRKRRAPCVFDPHSYKPYVRAIHDDSSDSDSSPSDPFGGLFPPSDAEKDCQEEKEEEEQDVTNAQTGWVGEAHVASRSAASSSSGWGVRSGVSRSGQASSSSSWGSPAGQASSSSSRPSWDTPVQQSRNDDAQGSWGVSISPEANSTSGWGQPSNVVTPDNQSNWGGSTSNTTSRTRSSGWGAQASTRNTWGSSSSSTARRYPHPAQGTSRITPSKYASQSDGKLEVCRESNDDFFLRWRFGSERVKVVEVGVGQCHSLDTTKDFGGGQEYTLIASKWVKQEARPSKFCEIKFGGSSYVKAFYLQGNACAVQKELNEIANFSELGLNPGKLASRLELLVSMAARAPTSDRRPYMFELPTSLIEAVDLPDNQTEGCGFIPSALLEELLGGGNEAKNALAVQVRVICPKLGIFKGELVRTAGIEKIQLPASMMKVGKSTAKKKSFKTAFVVLKSVSPSMNNKMMERQLNPHSMKAPTKSSERDLRDLGVMVTKMLLGCGVPGDKLESYIERSRSFDGRKHAYLTGVCDCTQGGLPPGTVFITGLGVGGCERKVFITRSPCTERHDAKILRAITEKPESMTDENWDHICSLSFGAVMFSSPSDESAVSLPESINNSDLDGDLFFCLWEPTLIDHVELTLRDDDVEAGAIKGDEGAVAAEEEECEEDDNNDELLGVHVPLRIDGNACDGIVTGKEGEKYVVEFGDQKEIMSHEELTADKAIIEDVVGHRGKGRNSEVEVLWSGGKRSWQAFGLMKEEAPDVVAEYALKNSLMGKRGWQWTKDYLRDAEIIKIQSHRCDGNTLKVAALYDGDTEPTWMNAKDVDVDILATYVEENDISLSDKPWKWLEKSIRKARKGWFAAAQERVSDVKRMAEYSRFVESLHRAHKKRGDITDQRSVYFGRAYKQALDIGKHGGRVSLPSALRAEVAPRRKAAYYDKFLKDV